VVVVVVVVVKGLKRLIWLWYTFSTLAYNKTSLNPSAAPRNKPWRNFLSPAYKTGTQETEKEWTPESETEGISTEDWMVLPTLLVKANLSSSSKRSDEIWNLRHVLISLLSFSTNTHGRRGEGKREGMDFNVAGSGPEEFSLSAQYTNSSMQKIVKKNQKSNGGLIYLA
jgi:hypothetical protein